MSGTRDHFPLATGLSRLVGSQIPDLVASLSPGLLEEVTPTTAELLTFWFQQDYCDLRRLNFHEGQRAAILHIVYAHEVLGAKTLRELYEAVAADAMLDGDTLSEIVRDRHAHPKYAAKMATGTGKTWVMDALLVWQYLNKLANPADDRFTRNFLIVAPGLVVYDRLRDSFQGKIRDGRRDFTTSDFYQQRDIFIPENYRPQVFSFLQSSVVLKTEIGRKITGAGLIAITNWRLLAGQEDPDFIANAYDGNAPDREIDAKDAVESFIPLPPGTSAGNSLDVLDRRFRRGRPLEALKDLPDLLVFNDEAHHIHEVRRADEVTDVEWQKSLLDIALTKGHRFIQIDFSATPYDQVSSGKKKRRHYFPHIVVDYDLISAMRSGLVKVLALDKRKDVASLPLDFRAERDATNQVTGLSSGQRVMLRAGLKKLEILEEQFIETDPDKHPKLLVICEDTTVTPHVVEFLKNTGLSENDTIQVDSGRKQDLGDKEWESIRDTLFDVDRHKQPKVIVSVLMLREGFDVNNICVIVPLRSSQASILLEQTIGRGLRLMWRGNDAIEELKRETRERIVRREEPNNYFDLLFIVEHPAFARFYEELLGGDLVGTVGDEADSTSATGDLERVDLRVGYQVYDFKVPIIIRDADEELRQPSINLMALPISKYQLDRLIQQIGKGDRFISQDVQTGTQYGDYRVDSNILTATGYNDYLSRMTRRITETFGRGMTSRAGTYQQINRFPTLQTYKPLITGWLDTYIRHRLFGQDFDPFEGENWRVLLLDDVTNEIATVFTVRLIEIQENQTISETEIQYRLLSEVKTIHVRTSASIDVNKCIYPKLPLPSKNSGLLQLFVKWIDQDTHVKALLKVYEHRHNFLRRPYLKADGLPAQYAPHFLVRTDADVYMLEIAAQSSLSEENVKRKHRAAFSWCEELNQLPPRQRADLQWHYVILSEAIIREWYSKNMRATELLDYCSSYRVTITSSDASQHISETVRQAVIKVCRSVFHRKGDLRSIFLDAGVPEVIYDRHDIEENPNAKVARLVLNELGELDNGGPIERKIVEELCSWDYPRRDIPDKGLAQAALDELRRAAIANQIPVDPRKATAQLCRERAVRDYRQQEQRRQLISAVTDRFHELNLERPRTSAELQQRGYALEAVLADLFEASDIQYRRPYRTAHEQIDGSFHFRGFTYIEHYSKVGSK